MPWNKRFDQQEVLERALDTFWAQGYTATSIQDLVDRMGINRASLYDTFGDKQDLFLAALRAYDENHRAAWLRELDALGSPLEALRRVFHDWVDAVEQERTPSGCFMVNTSLERAPHDEAVREHVARAQQALADFFGRKIDEAQRAGEVPVEMNADAAASSMLATFMGMLVMARSGADPEALRGTAEGAIARLG
ncbi:transcriptional regulator, TetR family [Limimonas halophila]|uniref:Transcriptional regulator, TetR family n=1 Tax=Limimonas halophila TaxID=1082479 RepID=A0A1G7L4H9_9PROT|nr:TetR/AcrR family transcriptional regulator [Limimonas halophila]SDF44244.1 transcriptional regulator, TetR family [Limimonas halophila]